MRKQASLTVEDHAPWPTGTPRETPVERMEEDLKTQETELLWCLSEGHTYDSAAAAMGVSINTVRSYVRSAYEKLQVHSKSAAVARALRAGLI